MTRRRRQSDLSSVSKVKKSLFMASQKAIYGSRYHEFRLKGKHPLRLLGTPKDPWVGSIAAGAHILSNYFYCEGQFLKNPNDEQGQWHKGDIWGHIGQENKINAKWHRYLHSFCWLRDLNRVVDRNAARKKAMGLSHAWLENFYEWHDVAWTPDLIGRRIVNWMAYAPLILDNNDLIYRSRLLNSLARQARHLYHTEDEDLRGLSRIQAISGLILAGLYIPDGEAWLKKGTNLLKTALAQELLADGFVASRNPEDLYRMLRDLLMVRTSYRTMGHIIPEDLKEAISRMLPVLGGLLHGDGKLILFNGSSEQSAQDIAATFSFADEPLSEGEGIDREMGGIGQLRQGSSRVFMDMAPPADLAVSQNAHAGTLSFEMSSGPQRIIVNCGCANALPTVPEKDLYRLSRATAAHSTLIINDKNSSQILKNGLIGHGPTLTNSHHISEKGHGLLEASHDGYQSRFGLTHHRTLYMNEAGNDLRGEDMLVCDKSKDKTGGKPPVSAPRFDIRFHLHPDIRIISQAKVGRLVLQLPNSENWQFRWSDGRLSSEDSLYLGEGARLRASRQIVLSGLVAGDKTVIKWSLSRIEPDKL